MSEVPEISCVVPAFESADLVRTCLVSILGQEDVRLEAIVSDDSRSGSVAEAVRSLGDERVRLIAGARSGNPVDNWNLGLAAARAPIRVLIHQDERLLGPCYLRGALDAFADDRGLAAVIGATVVSGGSKPSRFKWASAIGRSLPGARSVLPIINWIGPTAAFVFRGDHRFDPDLVQLTDVEFYSRVLRTGPYRRLAMPCVGSIGYHADQITARIDPAAQALRELDRFRAGNPPTVGPLAYAAARAAVRARQWTR